MKYLKTYEDYNTGIFQCILNGHQMIFNLKIKDDGKIFLMLDNDLYAELSVTIPESKNLLNDEFYLNPKIDKKIVDELVKQNFITVTNNSGNVAGEETPLCKINF